MAVKAIDWNFRTNHEGEKKEEDVLKEAKRLATVLHKKNYRLVLAESCTGGTVASALTRVPGISKVFCGSAVTYRNATKEEWLSIRKGEVARLDPVSRAIAIKMALGVLKRTSEARISGSITGHLGPNAPKDLDGVVYFAVAQRTRTGVDVRVARRVLSTNKGKMLRFRRQLEASHSLLLMVRSLLLE